MPDGRFSRQGSRAWSPGLGTIGLLTAGVFVVAMALTVDSLRTSWSEIVDLRDHAGRVESTYETLLASELLLSLLKDAETGQRGYLLTGDPAYLEPYSVAIAAIPGALQRFASLTSESPTRAPNLLLIERTIAEKIAELDHTIRVRREQGPEAATKIVVTGEGRRIMDALRAAMNVVFDEERSLLRARSAAVSPKAAAIWNTVQVRAGLLLLSLGAALTSLLILARRRAELARARDLIATTLASIGDAVMTTDNEGRITYLNPIAEELTGWRSVDAATHSVEEVFRIVNQQSREEVESPTVRALRDGVIVGLANHTVLISRDGTERAIDDSASPIRDDQGHVEGVVLIFRDITERYDAARRLAESERRKASVIEASIDCIVKIDHEGRVVEFNPAAEQTFGHRRDDVIGKPMAELIIPSAMRAQHQQGMAHYLATGEGPILGKRLELSALRADGSEFPIELAVSRVAIDGPPLFAAFIRDLTDRKRAEKRVLESEVRYRRLFESAKDGVLILDGTSGKIIDANAFMSALIGLEHGELVGKYLHEIGVLESAAENVAAFRQLQLGGYVRNDHTLVNNRRGERIEVEFIGNAYREDDRLLVQFNIRRISERIAMQKQLAEQAVAIAAESRRKDEFLAMLSHELRNPLAPIRAAVQMLKELRPSESSIEHMAHGIIERQVGNLTRLVSDLLEVSRVLSGRVRLELQVVDLNVVMRHAVETARPLIDQRSHELVLQLCENDVWANVDTTRMEEVLVNLLNNAAKYTPEGGRIEVYCEHPRGASHVQIRVRDNGIGIEPELLQGDRIFDLFMQADRALDRSQGGLGLGLTLARRLTVLHGGTLEVKSPPEGETKGSEFTVKLPLMLAPLSVLSGRSESEASTAQLKGVKVLVVDDNVDLVTMVATSLRLKGYSVEAAYTGPDGLRLARAWKPDVVLLDIGLPMLDGYEVARRLRADPGESGEVFRGRLIAATGYGHDTDIVLSREAGFDAHLVKPYDLDDLERLLAEPQ